MRGREFCWSDPKLQKLAKQFVAASDEVWRLHNLKELDCQFFQGFCEEGHYGGRARPSSTRQGIYCCTPAGKFLASVNTTDPKRMARMLTEALEAWKKVPAKERYLDYDPATRADEIRRRENQFPADGLPLRVYTRDMPRKDLPDDWRGVAWNVDSLWYRQTEARAMLPQRLKKGASVEWPTALVQRLIRHHLVDNVRGQTNGYGASQVMQGQIKATVIQVDKRKVVVQLEGVSQASTTGAWPKDGKFSEMSSHGQHSRGVQTTLFGEAEYSKKDERFTRFELAARGTRWGQTRYNFRQDDLDETPIGFAIILDEKDPGRRVAPAEFGAYGW